MIDYRPPHPMYGFAPEYITKLHDEFNESVVLIMELREWLKSEHRHKDTLKHANKGSPVCQLIERSRK